MDRDELEEEWQYLDELATCRFTDSKQPIDYRNTLTPTSYHCGDCQRNGVKLWMDRDPEPSTLELCCIICVAIRENVTLDYLYAQSNGQLWGEVWGWKYWTYETPAFVPAVPFPTNDTFYRWGPGYRPPSNALGWWGQLPVW